MSRPLRFYACLKTLIKGLKQRLEGYVRVVHGRLKRPGVEVVNLGLIDSPFKALEAGHRFRQEDVDLIFLHVTTCALSSTVLPVVHRAKVPVIVLNHQPPGHQLPGTGGLAGLHCGHPQCDGRGEGKTPSSLESIGSCKTRSWNSSWFCCWDQAVTWVRPLRPCDRIAQAWTQFYSSSWERRRPAGLGRWNHAPLPPGTNNSKTLEGLEK